MSKANKSGDLPPGPPPPRREPLLLTARQAGEYLGLSKDYMYRKASEGLVPHRRIGNRTRFIRTELDEWVRRQPGGFRDEEDGPTND